jgi:hypothetical protein
MAATGNSREAQRLPEQARGSEGWALTRPFARYCVLFEGGLTESQP